MDYDRSFKIIAHTDGPALARLADIRVDEWTPIGDTLQTTERLADRAFRASRDGRHFVVYFESQTVWTESVVWSLLSKSGLLSERERLPTEIVVFVLTPQGYRDQQGNFRLESVVGRTTQQIWFHEICLWRLRPEPWWELNPGLMALLPLCAHEGDVREAVTYAAEAIRHRSLDGARRADLLATLAFFGSLADDELDIFSIIAREEMRENLVAQAFIQEGRLEGRLEGRQEATVLERREAVRLLVEVRFGESVAAGCDAMLGTITDPERLAELRLLAKTASVAAFLDALKPG